MTTKEHTVYLVLETSSAVYLLSRRLHKQFEPDWQGREGLSACHCSAASNPLTTVAELSWDSPSQCTSVHGSKRGHDSSYYYNTHKLISIFSPNNRAK